MRGTIAPESAAASLLGEEGRRESGEPPSPFKKRFITLHRSPPAPMLAAPMDRPWISANLALSADGKISSVDRRPTGWTSRADHERLRELRHGVDALLVGRGTWQADRMTMTVRDQETQPLRCVVSRSGKFDSAHPMFGKAGGPIHLLVTGSERAADLLGATMHRGSLEGFLATLAHDHGVRHLHCEGGGELIRALAELDAIDELHLTWAGHTLFGGKQAPTASGVPGAFLPASLAFELVGFQPVADCGECFLSYRRKRSAQ
jgi:riboflavin biosynthesis pyrimidine reductase